MKKLLTLIFILLIGAGMVYSQTITVTSPNGGQNWALGSTHNVTWTSSGVTGNVGIKLFKDGASLGYVAENIAVAGGTYSWTISNVIGVGPISAGTTYKIQVKQSGVAGDLSDANFEISGGSGVSIEVTSPNGGENWDLGSTHNVTWTSSGISGNVGVKLFQGGSSLGYVGQNVPNTGSYSWTISNIIGGGAIAAGTTYKIQVKKDGVTGDLSDANFTLKEASSTEPGTTPSTYEFEVYKPAESDKWIAGGSFLIKWRKKLRRQPVVKFAYPLKKEYLKTPVRELLMIQRYVKIEYKKVKCLPKFKFSSKKIFSLYMWKTIINKTLDNGTHQWNIPAGMSPGCYKIKVTKLPAHFMLHTVPQKLKIAISSIFMIKPNVVVIKEIQEVR